MTKDKIVLFVDGDKYEWDKNTITGAELRVLAGIPQGAQIFLKVPSMPDAPIADQTTTELVDRHGPARFSTQSPGSQAG
jgi:hypothetical protein